MIDEAAFIRTIQQNPLDDAPRLVFADYLTERGEFQTSGYLRLTSLIADSLDNLAYLNADARRLLEVSLELRRTWRLRVGRRYAIRIPSRSAASFSRHITSVRKAIGTPATRFMTSFIDANAPAKVLLLEDYLAYDVLFNGGRRREKRPYATDGKWYEATSLDVDLEGIKLEDLRTRLKKLFSAPEGKDKVGKSDSDPMHTVRGERILPSHGTRGQDALATKVKDKK